MFNFDLAQSLSFRKFYSRSRLYYFSLVFCVIELIYSHIFYIDLRGRFVENLQEILHGIEAKFIRAKVIKAVNSIQRRKFEV